MQGNNPDNGTDSAEADVWDDKLLIKAYNNSIKLVREDLAKRIAHSTNSQNTQGEQIHTSSKSDNTADDAAVGGFDVGDYVRATFDDGCDYEAKIVSVDKEEGLCLLKYIGYGNKQEVRLEDLVPSFGKKARRIQFERAKGAESQREHQKASRAAQANVGTSKKSKSHSNGFLFGSIPPPPPMPPMLAQKHEDAEHLSAMLMSWYMSGYYTGVYQGIQIAKGGTKTQK